MGLTFNELYFDPDYSHEMRSSFAVFRGGKKVIYALKVVDGVTSLQQVDRTVSQLSCASDESVDDPKPTYPCRNCEELMYEAASPQQHMMSISKKSRLSHAHHREVHCPSGHVFCFRCWRDRLQTQLLDANSHMGMLFCMSPNCGESLDMQWAPVLFDTPDLIDRFHSHRTAAVAECLHLKRCPRSGCGVYIHLPRQGDELTTSDSTASNDDNNRSNSCALPQATSCKHGHQLCTTCFGEGHSPLYCEDVGIWKDYVARQRANFAGNPVVVKFLNSVLSKVKKCPSCGTENRKDDACNKMR